MSCIGNFEENMDLSRIYLAVRQIVINCPLFSFGNKDKKGTYFASDKGDFDIKNYLFVSWDLQGYKVSIIGKMGMAFRGAILRSFFSLINHICLNF